jgi:hypothetical protein
MNSFACTKQKDADAPLQNVSDQAAVNHEALGHLEGDSLDAVAQDLVHRLVDLRAQAAPRRFS